MRHILLLSISLLFTALLCLACKDGEKKNNYSENRARMEAEAAIMLTNARRQLANGQPIQAKATINNIREKCYLAIDAREQGILLMDSVDLSIARAELLHIDSLMRVGDAQIEQAQFEEACRKVQFYERKIQFDRSK